MVFNRQGTGKEQARSVLTSVRTDLACSCLQWITVKPACRQAGTDLAPTLRNKDSSAIMKTMQDTENNAVNSEVVENTHKDGNRVYEVAYLFLPTISEDDTATAYGNLKELITSSGGEVISSDMPKMIGLSYTMYKVIQNVRNKFDNAYFGWIKFIIEPEKALELKKKLDLEENLLRFLMVKTVKENTISSRRFTHKEGGYKKSAPAPKKEEGSETPIDKEEIDKEIEAMVS